MTFSIDDVRESFEQDVRAGIAAIAETGDALRAVWLGPPPPATGVMFSRLEEVFHTLYGTTSLVGATSLSQTSRALEALCARGVELAAQSEELSERARAVAAACSDAAGELGAMLGLELDGQAPDARAVGELFLARHADLLRAESVVTPSTGSRAMTAPEPASSAPERVQTPLEAELLDTFREETEAAVAQLRPLFGELRRARADQSLAVRIERFFHTLKGAAAAVGLRDATDLALRLQHRMERVLDQDAIVDDAFLATLLADANRLFDAAGALGRLEAGSLPAAALPSSSGPRREFSFVETQPGDLAELHEIFRAEAAESLRELESHIRAFQASPDDLTWLARAERVAHTLKGAAATVGMGVVGALASDLRKELQDATESEVPVRPSFAPELLAKLPLIAASAGLEEMPVAADLTGSVPEKIPDVPRQHILDEANEILREANRLTRDVEVALDSERAPLLAQLARLLHRLKGSAALTKLDDLARAAGALQLSLEQSAPSLPVTSLREGLAKLERLVARPPNGPSPQTALERFAVEPVADPALLAAVQQESEELVESIERNLFLLEQTSSPRAVIEDLFRDYHTLKGVVNTAGLTPTGQLLHRVEDFLETLATRQVLPALRDVTSFLLEVQADVRRQMKQSKSGFIELSFAGAEREIARLLRGLAPSQRANERPSQAESEAELSGSARASGAEDGSTSKSSSEKGYIRVATQRLDTLMNLAGELVVNRSRLTTRVSSLRQLQQELRRSSRRLVETVDRFREDHEFSGVSGQVPATGATPAADTMQVAPWSNFSEIELDRYDDVNVLARSLTEITSDVGELHRELVNGLSGFADDSEAFSAIVSRIQGEVTRARMVELETLFARLRLPIRDAAQREGKVVQVLTRGEEVQLDKTIADALFNPMLHLVRNAVVHGIEPAETRLARGKAARGTITLEAREEAGQIVIRVHDDGAGLDLEALLNRGTELGLVARSTPLSDPRVRQLVFAPRLSTKATAGDVSGRGIGGDVVRRAVERLNGTIDVETGASAGTVFSLTLPITLSITRALLVRDRGRTFAISLHFPERIVDSKEADWVESAGVRRLRIDGAYLPVSDLGKILGRPGEAASTGPVLVLRMGERRLGVQVEGIVGQEEVVIKGLGELLEEHPLFAGVTIRGNGELVLVLDVPALIEQELGEEQESDAPVELALPTAPSLDPQGSVISAVSEVAQESPPGRSSKLRVLFADDSLSVRKVAERTLQSLGVEVTLAIDGADALAKLRSGEFDILFTDLEMPRMHGYDLIRELRFTSQHATLPIVVVSSRSGPKHQDQARSLGASEYLSKPFSAASIEAALQRFCRGAAAPAAADERPTDGVSR